MEQENEPDSLLAVRGYGDPRRPKASCQENSSKSNVINLSVNPRGFCTYGWFWRDKTYKLHTC